MADKSHHKQGAVTAQKLTDSAYMLQGEGGNIGVFVGTDGVIVVDSQFPKLHADIKKTIKEIAAGKPVHFLVNTHFHYDHTDGNANFKTDGAHIIAHENTRKLLKQGALIEAFGKEMAPAAPNALPVITFEDALTLHQNDAPIMLVHVPAAHTNSDVIVLDKARNIIHAGDTFFSGMYPFIDVSNGGTVDGYIAAQEKIVALADDATKIIPGHGPLADKKMLHTHVKMLRAFSDIVKGAIAEDKSLEDTLALKQIKAFGADYGQGFLDTKTFTTILYNHLKK